MTDAIAPLVPPEVDLRNFPFMPLDVVRLRDSDLSACATAEEFRCAVLLWCASWHQQPAGSLQDDEKILASLAGFGRAVNEWNLHREGALRNWVKCSDGRLYHPVVAEKALEGWIEKLTQRKSSAAGNAKRYGHSFNPHPLDRAIESCIERLAALNPSSRMLAKRSPRVSSGTPDGNETEHKETPVGSQNPPDWSPSSPVGSENSPGGSAGRTPDHLPLTSQETLKGHSFSLRSKDACASDLPDRPVGKPKKTAGRRKHPFPDDAFEVWYQGYPHKVARGAAEKAFAKVAKNDQVSFETLVAERDRYIAAKPLDRSWCNPATWLNERRWLDEPASLFGPDQAPRPASPLGPHIDLGGGILAPYSTIRNVWSKGRWPGDWGPAPNEPGCRIPRETMSIIMGEKAA